MKQTHRLATLNNHTVKFITLTLLLAVSICAMSQQVTFLTKVLWDDVKKEAAAKNKYIFVDCSASWCAPCKEMDEKIFTDSAVGSYLSEHFISMRLQFDVQDSDSDFLAKKKEEIRNLSVKYKITGLPTLLVFNPRGTLVYRGGFYHDGGSFLEFLRSSREEDEQYFFLHEQFNAGNHDREVVAELLPLAVKRKNERLAKKLKATQQ